MSLFEDVPGRYPLTETAPAPVAAPAKKEYVRVQRTRAERRARRLAGVRERKALRRQALGGV